MKYLKKYHSFNEGWFDDNLKGMSDDSRLLIISFSEPFKDLKKYISNWKTIDNTKKVYIDLENIIINSIDNLKENILKCDKKTLLKSWTDIENFLINLKNTIFKDIRKKYESVESNMRNINKILIEIFDLIIDNLNFFKSEFAEQMKKDDYRKGYNTILTKLKESIITDIKRCSSDDNDNNNNNNDNIVNTQNLKPGEKITYKKKNGIEEIAEIAYNQLDNENDKIIRVNNFKSKFFIKKDAITLRIDNNISSEEIKNKIDTLSNKELEKVKQFLSELN